MSDELRVSPSWPGVSASPDRLRVDPDEFDALARTLETAANELSSGGKGSPDHLAEGASLPCASFGSWQTAYEMETGHHEARHYVVHYYRELITAMRQTAEAARAAARRYRDNESALQGSMNQHESALPGTE